MAEMHFSAINRRKAEAFEEAFTSMTTSTVPAEDAEDAEPLSIEKIMAVIDSLPPPPPPSPNPTRFEHSVKVPPHMGLIVSNDNHEPVGTMCLTGPEEIEIAVLQTARNTYAICGGQLYEFIRRKFSEAGISMDGLNYKLVDNKGVDISP